MGEREWTVSDRRGQDPEKDEDLKIATSFIKEATDDEGNWHAIFALLELGGETPTHVSGDFGYVRGNLKQIEEQDPELLNRITGYDYDAVMDAVVDEDLDMEKVWTGRLPEVFALSIDAPFNDWDEYAIGSNCPYRIADKVLKKAGPEGEQLLTDGQLHDIRQWACPYERPVVDEDLDRAMYQALLGYHRDKHGDNFEDAVAKRAKELLGELFEALDKNGEVEWLSPAVQLSGQNSPQELKEVAEQTVSEDLPHTTKAILWTEGAVALTDKAFTKRGRKRAFKDHLVQGLGTGFDFLDGNLDGYIKKHIEGEAYEVAASLAILADRSLAEAKKHAKVEENTSPKKRSS